MAEIAQTAAIGTHHDTIPSTSKDFVHDNELKLFQTASEASGFLLKS